MISNSMKEKEKNLKPCNYREGMSLQNSVLCDTKTKPYNMDTSKRWQTFPFKMTHHHCLMCSVPIYSLLVSYGVYTKSAMQL
jgi:hypothetical protein